MTYALLHSNTTDYIIKRRKLRLNPTKAEEVLWRELHNKKLGYKFRRQFQIENYIVDFYCRELKLIIELDGPIHDEQKEYDKLRTKNLEKLGLVVIRYLNDEVLFERDRVMKELPAFCDKRDLSLRPRTPPYLP
ncbi:MAG: hypothetical protein COY69_02620 [Candidatus Magasanikbacteria bacterium CG_4_10_14_0_8_um_filter_32_14]|uniref:DUF559 domain-containing protein n=2 Tax=Candidatus Magasanikiibacteriota TaxID=1752731 RepID=A0A2M7R9L0_9BACT|nr:MAG: hypothetical protein AUJ23_00685 [Candidatus Magasanikbacteria bacterium CG1_02_32_51]PIY93247.1 MAG: hypothetical protein COY69_02620 [Candidatus Magasanikbacteria bacterium CG_4_10_14_0_8_um_filter_32_14]